MGILGSNLFQNTDPEPTKPPGSATMGLSIRDVNSGSCQLEQRGI